MSFSEPFASPALPYYTGAVTGVDTPPAVVGLAGISYPIDLTQYRHNYLPGLRDGAGGQTGEASDQLFDYQGGWARYGISWHHGAGQRILDLDADRGDRRRFDASRGIDPWTDYQICLHRSTSLVRAAAADDIHMVATATHVYVSNGTAVARSADLSAWTSITGMAAETVNAMTTDGTDAYIATDNHIYRIGVGSAAATDITPAAPTNDFENIAFVANRLLVSDGNILAEVATASLDDFYTHFQPAFRWNTIFQVGSRIYVGGFAGNRSELYSLTTTDAGALALSAEAATFFAGELLRTALSYGGSVILGTSKGVRFASLGSDATLQYGPLIQDPGDVLAIAAEGRFAWFGWDDFEGGGSGVGRLALDTFVDTLQPAYASDVFTDAATDVITACARFANRTLFAVSGIGVYASSSTEYITLGYLDTGEIFFGTVEDKSITEARIRLNEVIETGETATLTLTDAATGVLLGTGTVSAIGDSGVAVNANGAITNRMTARITLVSDGSSTPCIRQWRALAYPIPPLTKEWLVPLIIHDRVLMGDAEGLVASFDTWTEVQRLRELVESREVVVYQEGNHAFRVRIDNLQYKPTKWQDGAEWLNGTCIVRLLSV